MRERILVPKEVDMLVDSVVIGELEYYQEKEQVIKPKTPIIEDSDYYIVV
jgi:hypothetical protein